MGCERGGKVSVESRGLLCLLGVGKGGQLVLVWPRLPHFSTESLQPQANWDGWLVLRGKKIKVILGGERWWYNRLFRGSLLEGVVRVAYRESKWRVRRNYTDVSSHHRDLIPGKALGLFQTSRLYDIYALTFLNVLFFFSLSLFSSGRQDTVRERSMSHSLLSSAP